MSTLIQNFIIVFSIGMKVSRRNFLKTGATIGSFILLPGSWLKPNTQASPSNRIRIAGIGIGGQGGADIDAVAAEGAEIVALCDVDQNYAAKQFNKYPSAKRFTDYRVMFDKMEKEIDAVVIGTPDHSHAVIAVEAMKRGKHVYCEKPLARTIKEVRRIKEVAIQTGVITQLGNQGHSSASIRRVCEWIWAGAIGKVKEVHCSCDAFPEVYSQIRNLSEIEKEFQIPPQLDWDLWIGPVQYRSYKPFYHPWNWRGWLPFGTGCIGDWICHVLDPAYWALSLEAPIRIKAEVTDYDPKVHSLTYPPATKIEFEFPLKDRKDVVKVIWYDGRNRLPRLQGLPEDEKLPGTGAIIVGENGFIVHGSHGAGGCHILPDKLMEEYSGKNAPPERIPRVKNHAWDWLQAIRDGRKAGSDIATYGAGLTQVGLLGLIAIRYPGQILEWDDRVGKFTNMEEANEWLDPQYRSGWNI